VPSITALLDKTGEFYKRTQKRYDDAALIVAEIARRFVSVISTKENSFKMSEYCRLFDEARSLRDR
jgi:hypothetical protein